MKSHLLLLRGKEKVSELFKNYVFENSSDIVLKEVNIKAQESDEQNFSLRLLVEETKTTDKIFKSRFLFEECTNFQFNDVEPNKITSIHMQVKRQSLQ